MDQFFYSVDPISHSSRSHARDKRGQKSFLSCINSLPWLLRLLGSSEDTEAKSHVILIVSINASFFLRFWKKNISLSVWPFWGRWGQMRAMGQNVGILVESLFLLYQFYGNFILYCPWNNDNQLLGLNSVPPTLEYGIDVAPWINVALGTFGKNNKRSS